MIVELAFQPPSYGIKITTKAGLLQGPEYIEGEDGPNSYERALMLLFLGRF
jgi:hypothetical protein